LRCKRLQEKSSGRLRGILGGTVILLAIVLNPPLLGWLFSKDGQVDLVNRIVIWGGEIYLGVAGVVVAVGGKRWTFRYVLGTFCMGLVGLAILCGGEITRSLPGKGTGTE
jgi:hypothetical protein